MVNLTNMGNQQILREFAVIGNPIDHSLSPILHNEVFNQLKIKSEYSKIKVESSNLSKFMNSEKVKKLKGFNVTIPHKTEIMSHLDIINPRAKKIGAVNCILKKNDNFWGFNTDWFGFSMALKKNYISVQNKSILILGAGGVSYAILYALIQESVSQIFIKNRTEINTKKLINQFKNKYHSCKILDYNSEILENTQIDIIINCTPIGMSKFQNNSPLKRDFILPKHIVIDTIYTPFKTQLLLDSEQNGATILNGLDMFIFQGLASLDIWFEENISENVDFVKLKEKLIKYIC